jgi:tetratricopeptide (TPR) repeat protein
VLVALLLIAALTLAFGALAGSVFPALRSIRLLNEGRYPEAERFLAEVVETTNRPAIRNAARYNLAVSLHRQGRFEESLIQLEQIPLHELDASLHGAANALYAWNLIFARRDLDRAEACIRASGPLEYRATTQFALAYLRMLQGRRAEADAILRAVTSRPPDRRSVVGTGAGSALVIDQQFEAIIEEHLLGLCAMERGDVTLARQHFARVAHTAHPSFYPRHAAALLAQIGAPLLPGHAA